MTSIVLGLLVMMTQKYVIILKTTNFSLHFYNLHLLCGSGKSAAGLQLLNCLTQKKRVKKTIIIKSASLIHILLVPLHPKKLR